MGFSYLKSAATGGAALGPDTFRFFVNMGIPSKAALWSNRTVRSIHYT